MPIVVQHGGESLASLAYAAGTAKGQSKRLAEDRQFAFRASENEANRQLQQSMQQQAMQNAMARDAQQMEMEINKRREIWQMKDEFEREGIRRQRARYLEQRQQIQDAYEGRGPNAGKVDDRSYGILMERLNKSYKSEVTDPFFEDISKSSQDVPTMKIEGQDVPMAVGRNGEPDPHQTRMDYMDRKIKLQESQAKQREKAEKEVEKSWGNIQKHRDKIADLEQDRLDLEDKMAQAEESASEAQSGDDPAAKKSAKAALNAARESYRRRNALINSQIQQYRGRMMAEGRRIQSLQASQQAELGPQAAPAAQQGGPLPSGPGPIGTAQEPYRPPYRGDPGASDLLLREGDPGFEMTDEQLGRMTAGAGGPPDLTDPSKMSPAPWVEQDDAGKAHFAKMLDITSSMNMRMRVNDLKSTDPGRRTKAKAELLKMAKGKGKKAKEAREILKTLMTGEG